MSREPWSDEENDLIVADCFRMLDAETSGRTYNKAECLRKLKSHLPGRNDKSIKYKHGNISAVLQVLGKDWIQGYKPIVNFQLDLVDAVARWSARNAGWMDAPRQEATQGRMTPIEMGSAPTLSNMPPQRESRRMLHVAHTFDVVERDKRNRYLGCDREKSVFEHERTMLKEAGRCDLADQVRWVSREEGDGADYDIASFFPNDRKRLIKVKTTNSGWERTPFYITRNELAVSETQSDKWCLFRLWDFSHAPKAFELYPPLTKHVELIATAYQANFGVA